MGIGQLIFHLFLKVVIIGSNELKSGTVRIKDTTLMTNDLSVKNGVVVKRDNLISEIKSRLILN